MSQTIVRPSWNEYFFQIAELVASRSTCLTIAVGAAIVKDRQILATGYNGVPPGEPHCTELGHCYDQLSQCGTDSLLPSRAIHAETNAIAQAAKYGISIQRATMYVTHEPCLVCLKLIVASGISQVVYQHKMLESNSVKDQILSSGLVQVSHYAPNQQCWH